MKTICIRYENKYIKYEIRSKAQPESFSLEKALKRAFIVTSRQAQKYS